MRRLALLPLALAACLPSPPAGQGNARNLDGIGVNRGAIVGGSKDTGDPGVVLLMGQKPGSQNASLCTGEVVSPHVVLTAAHCVDPAVVGSGLSFSVFLGTDLNDSTQINNNALWVDVASTDFNQGFDVNNLQGGNDIAVAVTATALTVPPLAVNQTALTAADDNATLRLVGYGVTSMTTQTDTSGVKRQVSTPLIAYDSKFLQFGDSSANTCEGDSGGPAFMTRNGQEVIVGVTSFGDQYCQQGGVDTRVDAYWTSFIAPHIMMADGSLPSGPSSGGSSGSSGGSTGGSTGGSDPGGVTPGQVAGSDQPVGASCTNGNQCGTGICTTGGSGYCTQTCNPKQADACPDGMRCGDIGGASYCLMKDSGCSASARTLAGRATAPLGPFFLIALCGFGLLVLFSRRRPARR